MFIHVTAKNVGGVFLRHSVHAFLLLPLSRQSHKSLQICFALPTFALLARHNTCAIIHQKLLLRRDINKTLRYR